MITEFLLQYFEPSTIMWSWYIGSIILLADSRGPESFGWRSLIAMLIFFDIMGVFS